MMPEKNEKKQWKKARKNIPKETKRSTTIFKKYITEKCIVYNQFWSSKNIEK